MPKFYPMMMNLDGRNCLVVGGGDVAARKSEMLVACGAKVKIVSPETDPEIETLVKNENAVHIKAKYRREHMESVALVIAATDNEEVNRAVYNDAVDKGIPVNVVDVPALCSFIVPSIVEQGDLIIAISTSGNSPAMSKRIRKELEQKFGPEYGKMLKLMGDIRRLYLAMEPDLSKRMEVLTKIANSDILERIRQGETFMAEDVLEDALKK